jgi:polyisoprenoid-binding protein YceI
MMVSNATIQITNTTGKVVYSKELNTSSGLITIPIMGLANGNYILKVSNTNNISIQKIVIAK